jgi:hypothetical protein
MPVGSADPSFQSVWQATVFGCAVASGSGLNDLTNKRPAADASEISEQPKPAMLLVIAEKSQAGSHLDLYPRFSQTPEIAAFLSSRSSGSNLPDMQGFSA